MDIETQLGTESDVFDGIVNSIDHPETVADDPEDQRLAESQTDSQEGGEDEGEDVDLSQPQFAYTDEDGNEVQLTGQQIIDLLQAQQSPEAKEEPAKEEPKEEAKTEDEAPFEVAPIDLQKVGPDLVAMLSGENGGEEALGPAMAEFQFQTFLQDPRFAQVLDRAVNVILERRDSERHQAESFEKFVGTKAEDARVKEFQKANPWVKSPREALLAMRLEDMKAEVAKVKSGTAADVAKAKSEGEKATIKNLKAKGTLRPIGSKGSQPAKTGTDDIKSKYDITDPDQRSRAMAEAIMRKRGMGG